VDDINQWDDPAKASNKGDNQLIYPECLQIGSAFKNSIITKCGPEIPHNNLLEVDAT
jgi:hypothetical protein